MPTRSLGFQSFYQAQLTSAISDTDLTIPLDVLPTPSEGLLVIESTVSGKREIIYYTSKTASAVVCPAGGRGYDGTTAVSHLQNSAVIMAPVAQMFKSLQDGSSMSSTVTLNNLTVSGSLTVGSQTPSADWSILSAAPNTVTANGNRSYSLVFNGVDYTGTLNPGTRVRTTRTVAAPNQCTSLNGTTQYYSKTSPNKLTFTDDFVVSAWVKISSYGASSMVIASRYNGTSGWIFQIDSTGSPRLRGFNSGSGNESAVASYQSIPLNKWVHVAAQLDMSTFTATTTTSYIMIDGVDVPAFVQRVGTNPTSLIQAGNLEIGSSNGGLLPFNGKIAQVAIYNAKVTQATILASMNQGLAGTETSLASAYSFNNSITDLNTTTPNDLTANGSAVATNADSCFGGQANGNISTTYDYGIIQSVTYSTNSTVVVQVPEGNTIPTSGGVTAVYYSSAKAPYGMPTSEDKWVVETLTIADLISGATPSTYYTNLALTIPIGKYLITSQATISATRAASGTLGVSSVLSTSSSTYQINDWTGLVYTGTSTDLYGVVNKSGYLTLTSATPYYWLLQPENLATYLTVALRGARGTARISAKNAYL